jgi:uncharacterized lipoprotein
MHVIFKSVLLTGFLASCASEPDSRYRETEYLERPPKIASSSPTKEQRAVDDSSIPKKKDHTGLGSDVYLSSVTQLNIKQNFSDAWSTLNRAFRQSGLKITDHERDKGLYYVTHDTADKTGFFTKALSFINHDTTIYLLIVKQVGEETAVTVTLANATEQNSEITVDGSQAASEGAVDLLQALLKTLRDDLKEE